MRAGLTPMPQPMASNQKFADWLGFNTFGDPELEKVVAAANDWWAAFAAGKPARWLSLIGVSGTGKTHCNTKLWRAAKAKSDWNKTAYLPARIYWPDFVDELRSGNAYERFNDMKRWPVLFLDDVGAERDPTGFAAEKLNTLLGCRMDQWTLLTSNKDLDGMKAVDMRIASRLVRQPNICVGINTKDYAER